MSDAHRERFVFHPVDAEFAVRTPGERADRLRKWDCTDSMVLCTFCYDKPLNRAEVECFTTDLFNDPHVREALPVCAGRARWTQLPAPVAAVRMAEISVTRVRMDLFDRIFDAGIARREGGYLAKCLDTPLADGLIASDRLRLMLLDDESDEYALYSAAERDELLFRALLHLAVGGGICQYEDGIDALLDSAKALYRDLVRVHKNGAGQLEVGSWTYRIDALESPKGGGLWPRESPHNFCYLAIDPVRRHAVLWSNAYLPL
ncbi:hypothetical protein T492DRAFT_961007 [Pavlovales sp. CCMP2436]|nr:hypothetical protein T492DRAFT_961007 [Pavlovales sp. CCMP2436]